ncbi:MAG: ribonuclease R [Rhodospirillaceae bacterium]
MSKLPRKPAPFPTKEAVLEFIRESPGPVGKREIARAFQLTTDQRVALKLLLKELETGGALERGRGRRLASAVDLPEVAVLDIVGITGDGEVLARPVNRTEADGVPLPEIFMQPEGRGHPSLAVGERVLARLRRLDDAQYEGRAVYEGRTIRRLEGGGPARMLGVYRVGRDGGRITSTDRRVKAELTVAPLHAAGAEPGELVMAEVLSGSRLGLRQARVVERLGRSDEPKTVSLIAIHSAGLPTIFPAACLEEIERAPVPTLAGRTDLRTVPLVTIDGADARDFDDAVAAEPDSDPANPGGWRLTIAIADVAWYVRPGGALDRSAFDRGNSAYFPDRVVPMLPEALSNELCSLKPEQDRPCLAVRLIIDRDGNARRHHFERGLMRSRARLTYEQVQAAQDGVADDMAAPLLEPVLAPLYRAFHALEAARKRRGTLDLDLPERLIRLNAATGKVEAILERPHYDSHRLIEEFMIAANVAAAETLEQHDSPLLYRVHDRPSLDKLEALRQFLESIGLKLARDQGTRPVHFNQILKLASDLPDKVAINEMILRSQSQAEYSPDNIGHFGLALPRYAHFTSPIRRYADLIVHRALIRAVGLGADGLEDGALARLTQIGGHISRTERRAAAAERDANDRYIASFLADRVGATFCGRISGVTRFGLFVCLEESGADGLIPISTLPADYYEHIERAHSLVGRRTGRTFRQGAPVRVRLVESDPLTASTLFALAETDEGRDHGKRATSSRKSSPGKVSRQRKR